MAFKPFCNECSHWHTESEQHVLRCELCGCDKRRDCDGQGWLEASGPYRDDSYVTSRPCPNDNPFAGD